MIDDQIVDQDIVALLYKFPPSSFLLAAKVLFNNLQSQTVPREKPDSVTRVAKGQ